MLERKEVEEIIKDIFRKHTFLTEKDSEFELSMYVDPRDELTEKQLKEIVAADNMMDCFYDELNPYVMELMDLESDGIIEIVKNNWDEEKYGCYVDYEDTVSEFIGENVSMNFPYEHYLKNKIRVNLLVDSGDGNYDYTLNNFVSYNSSEDEEIEDESSILWLAKQQGYTKKQLTEAVKKGKYHKNSELLKTIHQECLKVSTHMNALSFFVSMSVEEFIAFYDRKQPVFLKKGTSCGLYDLWNGAGGMLEITLEKDVQIPFEYALPHIEGTRGYGIDSIYGLSHNLWTDTVISSLQLTSKN
ncbi:hypothetical protein U8V72_20210 [Priestia filamentosa]|uniref:hypothetical protein n=1 Tax=Priestia filamentosa TaxID=1402861 RepID=UPI00397A17B1